MATYASDQEMEWARLLTACKTEYSKCIDTISHSDSVTGAMATTRLHHLRFDGNGQPMVRALAEALYEHILGYCLASRSRPRKPTDQEKARIVKEARKLFIRTDTGSDEQDKTGEAGEILLYFLLETVLDAPQMVAKMDLKTNRKDEVKGADGIHMKWSPAEALVDVYFGESKLHGSISSALSSLFSSISRFHEHRLTRREFSLVTRHYKHADSPVKSAVTDLLSGSESSSGLRLNHACLVGYDWNVSKGTPEQPLNEIIADFRREYAADSARLHKLLQKRFDDFKHTHLRLRFEVFFLPFPSVQEFRTAFNEALE